MTKRASSCRVWPRVASQDCFRPNDRSPTLAAGRTRFKRANSSSASTPPTPSRAMPPMSMLNGASPVSLLVMASVASATRAAAITGSRQTRPRARLHAEYRHTGPFSGAMPRRGSPSTMCRCQRTTQASTASDRITCTVPAPTRLAIMSVREELPVSTRPSRRTLRPARTKARRCARGCPIGRTRRAANRRPAQEHVQWRRHGHLSSSPGPPTAAICRAARCLRCNRGHAT